MPWWGWIVVGGILLAAEMFAVDAEFFLIFIGLSALVVGAADLAGLNLPIWGEWLLFAILSVTLMFTFRRKVYQKMRGSIPDMPDNMTGQRVLIAEDLAPGAECRISHRGSEWTARNIGKDSIAGGTRVSIAAVDGLTLHVGGDPT